MFTLQKVEMMEVAQVQYWIGKSFFANFFAVKKPEIWNAICGMMKIEELIQWTIWCGETIVGHNSRLN